MSTSQEESFKLMGNEFDSEDYNLPEIPARGPRRSLLHQPNNFRRSFFCVFAIFVALDVAAYLYVVRLLSTSPTPSAEEMDFRNPYVGLDELYNEQSIKPSDYGSLINVPRLATQISRAEPKRIFPVDVHRWLSDFGTLSPPDRHLLVTNTIHTIIQFNVLDYGMESCAIAVRLPPRDAILPHDYSVKDIRGTIRLNICELEATRPLNARTISWENHPRCVREMGALGARVGDEVQLEPFPCKSGSFLAYEISCSSETPGCAVDVWSNHNDTWGAFIRQYQTI